MKIYNLRLDDNTNKIYYGAGTNGSIELLQGSGTSGGAGNTLTGTNGIIIENNKVGLGGRFLTTTEDISGLTSTMELDSNNFRIYHKVGAQDILTFKLEPDLFLTYTESTSFDYSTIQNKHTGFEIDNGNGDGNSFHTLEVSSNGFSTDAYDYNPISSVENYTIFESNVNGLSYSGNNDDPTYPQDQLLQVGSDSIIYDGNHYDNGNTEFRVSSSTFGNSNFKVKTNNVDLIKNRILYSTSGVAVADWTTNNLKSYSSPVQNNDVVNKKYVDNLVGTSGVGNFIPISGNLTPTTGNIKVGDSFGLSWGTSGSSKMTGYENDVIQIETANTSGQSSYIQISPTLVNIHGNSASLGNGYSAFVLDETIDGVSLQNNGYYSTLKNDLLTTDRTYSFPDESGEFMLGTRVKFRTTANLTATYNNGVGGVGATLTATTNSTLPTIDAITVANQNVGDRLLVANQTAMLQNGIYVITSKGVAGVSPFILTRASDDDSSDKIYKRIIKIDLGSAFGSSTTINTNTTAITMGTTSITYAVHGNYTAGAGISLTSRAFSIGSGAINRNMLQNGVATSVIGRSANSNGAVADIAASSDGQVLKRVGTALGFHQIGNADIANSSISYSKIQAISGNKLLGNISPLGSIEEIALTSGLVFTGNNIQVDATIVPKLSLNNTFTGTTNQFGSLIQMLDTTYKNALQTGTNLIAVGNGFPTVFIGASNSTINLGGATSTVNLGGGATATATSLTLSSNTVLLRANSISGVSAASGINIGGILSTSLNNPVDIGGVFNGATYATSFTSNSVATPALNLRTSSNAGSAGSGSINITVGANTGGGVKGQINMNGKVLVSAGTTANNTAALEVVSTTQGFLPPKMTTVQISAISSPASGLLVYDTTASQMKYYNGSFWVAF